VIPAQKLRDLLYREAAHEQVAQPGQLRIRPFSASFRGRFVPNLGPLRIDDQGADPAEESLLFGMGWPAQEVADFDIRNLTARRRVSLMPDGAQAGRGVAGKEPGIAVRAAVELLHPVLFGLRTERGVLYPIRRHDTVSGLAQSGDDAGS